MKRVRRLGRAPFDVAVVGGGTAGVTAALAARHEGARVVLVEQAPRLGGDCTFVGCVPSKALVEVARVVHETHRAAEEGLLDGVPRLDFRAVRARRARIVEEIAHDDRDERLVAAGIDVVHGRGGFVGPRHLAVGGEVLHGERFVIATGTEPLLPGGIGLDPVRSVTNETVFGLERLPRRLLVLGGGPTGLELAQAFRRFGSEVAVVEREPRLLRDDEPEAGRVAADVLAGEGVELHLAADVRRVRQGREGSTLELANGCELLGDTLLVAAGRRAATTGLGLDRLGVALDRDGFVKVDERCRTSARHVFAAGDVTGGALFTHVAAHEGRVAGLNAAGRRKRLDGRVVPAVTFLDPEIARVGLTEARARAERSGVETVLLPLTRVDRPRIAGRAVGFVKLVTAGRRWLGRVGGGELVGAQVVAPRAGELVHECALAMQAPAFAGRLAQTIHAYPSESMAVQQAAAHLFPLGRALVDAEPR